MTIEQYLAELGYSAEEVGKVMADPLALRAVKSAMGKYDEGKTALTAAENEKRETAQFWETETQKLQGSVNRLTAAEARAARAEGEAARRTAYLKSLKDSGYDVPDDMIGASAPGSAPPPQDPATGKYLTIEDFDKRRRLIAPDLVRLAALTAEYSDVIGKPYTQIYEDFEEAQKLGRPVTEHVRAKYSFEAKRQEKAAAAETARVNALVDERYKAKEAELVAQYGTNSNTRAPLPSKFDKLTGQPGFKNDSWKSPEGRKANREERMRKFENITLQ